MDKDSAAIIAGFGVGLGLLIAVYYITKPAVIQAAGSYLRTEALKATVELPVVGSVPIPPQFADMARDAYVRALMERLP